jgi:hypothetical protein
MVEFKKLLDIKKIQERKIKLKDFINIRNNYDVCINDIVADKKLWFVLDFVENQEVLDELFNRETALFAAINADKESFTGTISDYFDKKLGNNTGKVVVNEKDIFTTGKGLDLNAFRPKDEVAVTTTKPSKK